MRTEAEATIASALLQTAETRRVAEDQTMWSVPALTIAGQAFVLTVALDPDTTRPGRVVACAVGAMILLAARVQMGRHRYFERMMSAWLSDFERLYALPRLHNLAEASAMHERYAPEARRGPIDNAFYRLGIGTLRLLRIKPTAFDVWRALLATLVAIYTAMLPLSAFTDVFEREGERSAGSASARAKAYAERVHHPLEVPRRDVREQRQRQKSRR